MCVQYIGGCSVHRGVFSTSGGVQYIGGIPWVHRGDTMSTSGGYHEYIGGISWVHRGVFSTSEGYHEYIGGVQYIGGIPWVHRGGYHEYIGGCSVHRGISWYVWGDTMSKSGDVQYIGGIPWVHRGDTMSTSGEYHEYIGGISWVHRGMFSTSEFSIEIERILSTCSPTCIMISLRCTEHPPMYSWYPPDVLMISPRCTHGIPPMYWTSSDVLMVSPHIHHDIPHIHHDIPPHSSWYPPDVLNIPRCTEHTLYRVKIRRSTDSNMTGKSKENGHLSLRQGTTCPIWRQSNFIFIYRHNWFLCSLQCLQQGHGETTLKLQL